MRRSSLRIYGTTIANRLREGAKARFERTIVEGGEQNEGEGERFEAGEGGEVSFGP